MCGSMIGTVLGLILGGAAGLALGVSLGMDIFRNNIMKAISGLKADDTMTVDLIREMLGGEK